MANSVIGRDMAVDLGTANTLVYVRGKGVLLDEPSVVAINETTDEILAVGHEAKRMIGRTPDNIAAIRPLKDGVIADFEATEQMLRFFIQQVHRRRYFAKPRLVVCVPSGITAVEQRAVKEAGYQAGARRVYIIEEPMAAAIGAGMPVTDACGSMVIDIGGGTTEVAVIALNGIVYSQSVRVGGDRFDEAIINYVRRNHGMLIGEATAERIKMEIGCAYAQPEVRTMEISGRNLAEGVPKVITINSNEVLDALREPLSTIIAGVKQALEQTPPELCADVAERGIVLTGGGAQLYAPAIRAAFPLNPIHMMESPCFANVRGFYTIGAATRQAQRAA